MYKRLPKHIGIIPDGNRRWALAHGYHKKDGYDYGVVPGVKAVALCQRLGIKEVTFYGFTVDNTKRPTEQKRAFQKACVDSVMALQKFDLEILVVGNTESTAFPQELLPFANKPFSVGDGGMRVNFLINYGWSWDLNHYWQEEKNSGQKRQMTRSLASKDISRMDLIIRWGGRRRLSGFLPVQSVYADFYVVDDYWPDYQDEHIEAALKWYQTQDITLGG